MLTYPYKIPRRGRKFHREKKRRRVASLDIIIKYFILIFKAHPTCAWYIVVHLVGFGGQHNQTHIKQGTLGVYTQETPAGEILLNQSIPVYVSIVQLVPLYCFR